MSLQTPEKIRTLQRKLYHKARTEPAYRFYVLYDKIWRRDILEHAYALAKANEGAAGVDGETFAMIGSDGSANWLDRLQEELRTKGYRPQAVRRVLIPKPGGGERPLGIPTIRDRVAQTAAKLVLEAIFEADLAPAAYGYRPGRSAVQAVEEVHTHLRRGYTDVVDADLSKYFDTIPKKDLMPCFARRIADRHVLHLLKMWLTAPVEEWDERGGRRLTGGRATTCGVPQGGVISPLAANLYMNRFLKYWRQSERTAVLRAHVVNYADDFVILSRGHAVEALAWTRQVMTRLGLTINETKTSVRDARHERFDFLGYSFGPHCHKPAGRWYQGASPSAKSMKRIKQTVRDLLRPANVGAWPAVRDRLNGALRGWAGYFRYGTRVEAFKAVDSHVYLRVRAFLARRHKEPTHGSRRFPPERVYGELGVLRLYTPKTRVPSVSG